LLETRPQIAAARQVDRHQGFYDEFAAPFGLQFWEVTKRVFEQYWRTPSYIYSKAALSIGSVRLAICVLKLELTIDFRLCLLDFLSLTPKTLDRDYKTRPFPFLCF